MTLNNELITVRTSVLEKMMKLIVTIVCFLMIVTYQEVHEKNVYTIY